MKKTFKVIVNTFYSLLFIFLIIGCEAEPKDDGTIEGNFSIIFRNNSSNPTYMWWGSNYYKPERLVQPGGSYGWTFGYYYKTKEDVISTRLNATDSINFDGFTLVVTVNNIEKHNNLYETSWDGHRFELLNP